MKFLVVEALENGTKNNYTCAALEHGPNHLENPVIRRTAATMLDIGAVVYVHWFAQQPYPNVRADLYNLLVQSHIRSA